MKLTNVNIKASGMNRAALAGWTIIAIWYQYNYSYIDYTNITIVILILHMMLKKWTFT